MQRRWAAKSVGTEIPGEWGRGWVSAMKRFRVRMGRGGQGCGAGCKKYVMGGLGVSRYMRVRNRFNVGEIVYVTGRLFPWYERGSGCDSVGGGRDGETHVGDKVGT